MMSQEVCTHLASSYLVKSRLAMVSGMGTAEVLLLLSFMSWSRSQVMLIPSQVVSIPEGFAAFTCRHPSEEITRIQWLLNGSAIEVHDRIGLLHLRVLTMEYNATTIECQVTVSSGKNFTSNTALLLIQGLLPPITNMEVSMLSNTNIVVTWNAPFSLLRDVTYCVDVVNNDSLIVVTSECGIAHTMFDISPLPSAQAIACNLFSVTVTPVNVVGNGTTFSAVQSFANEGLDIILSQAYFDGERINFQIALSAPVCTATATLMALHNTSTTFLIQLSPGDSRRTLAFSDPELGGTKHVFNAVFELFNINEAVDQTMSLSTHSMQSISFNISSHLELSVGYAEGSATRGVLIFLLFIISGESRVNFSTSICVALERGASTLPFPIPNNQYLTFGYDILKDGLLQTGTGYPANRDSVYRLGNNSIDSTIFKQPLSNDIGCSIKSQALTINLICTCKLGVGVTGFQVIVQRNDEHNYQSLFRVNVCSGSCSRSVVHEVEESGNYGVSVFPVREHEGIINSLVSFFQEISLNNSYPQTTTATATATPDDNNLQAIIAGFSAGLGCTMILIIAAIVCGAVLIITNRKVKLKHKDATVNSKETELVYEEIGDPQSSFKYTQNVVYGMSMYCTKNIQNQ